MTSSAHPMSVRTPAAEGVDARGVLAFVDALDAAPDIEPHSLMIVRHDHLVAAGWWAPYTADRVHLLYSLSKSFTSTAAGLAVAEGLLRLDDPVISYFPEFEADITDPRSRAMLVRHVAAMASGHLSEMAGPTYASDPREPVRSFLLLPPERDPGTVFAYNQPCTYTLAAIVQRVTGQTLTEYLRPRVLDPLGIGETAWVRDRLGREIGYSGLHATTDAIARLGLLHLRGGVWQGRQLLPASWVAEASRAHVANADGTAEGAASDWQQGYGFKFWMSRHGYRGDGAYGQFCLVLPEHDAVVAMTGATEQMQKVLDLAWKHLLPAFGPAPLTGATADRQDAALRERLSRLALPVRKAESAPPDAAAWSGAHFVPQGGTCPQQPSLTGVGLAVDGDDWVLSLTDDGSPLDLRFTGTGTGRTTDADRDGQVPTAVSAGWTDPDTLVADIWFLETPHRLVVTCSLTTGAFTAHWHTPPLSGDPLRKAAAPRA